MKVLRPVANTAFYSSDIPEPDTGEVAWNSGTTYAAGDIRYLASTHRRYESLQAGNLNHSPDTSPTWWQDIGGTNKYAMIDNQIGTSSWKVGTSFTATLITGVCDSLFLYGLEGDEAVVEVRDGYGGTLVYSKTLQLQVAKINDWYAYYFEAFRFVPAFVLTDLPPYLYAHVTLTITAASTSDLKCGMFMVGRSYEIGSTQYGVSVGIRDYSRKTIDSVTGYAVLSPGRFAKTMRAQVRVDQNKYPEIHATLESLRATACVWIGDSSALLEPLIVYGFYKDFSLTVDLPSCGVYGLDIEGMV